MEYGIWKLVQLPAGLPPVELGVSPRLSDSGSPEPGRPGQERREKRDRESTCTSKNNKYKLARKDLDGPDVKSESGEVGNEKEGKV